MREPIAWVLDGYGVRSTCGRYRLVQERRRKPWRLLVDGKEKKGTYATLWDAFGCIESDQKCRDGLDIDWLQCNYPELKGLANEVLVKIARHLLNRDTMKQV